MEQGIHLEEDTKVFGFWIYLMTDLVIFAVLFATYAVLHNSTFGGPSSQNLFHLPSAFAQTLILLTSSFTCSLFTLALQREKKSHALIYLGVTFLLGCSFLTLEYREFSEFIHKGASWERSGFLSSFFALVGTHGFHIFIGLLWMAVALTRILRRGLIKIDLSKMIRLALFWHFLDVVWIFIFSVVYVLGHMV